MSTEPKTGETYWAAGILQPDLLFNALLRRIGAVGGQATVKDKDLATPPGSPAAGDTYIVAASPTGAWVGHATHIAYYDGTTWIFYTPAEGWRVDVADEDSQYRFDGAAWVSAAGGITALTGDVTASGAGSVAATLATAQPGAHTWAATQTFTLAPVFTDQSGTRTALGLGTAAVLASDTDTTLAANSDARAATQKAVKAYIDALLAASDAVTYEGAIDCSANPNYPAADAGHLYIVSVAGKIGGASGVDVEAGDMAICKVDGSAAGDQATVGANWNVIQTNIGYTPQPALNLAANEFYARGSAGAAANKPVSDDALAFLAAANDSAMRTELGATTLGGNLFTFPNPSAVRFIRINADNTVTARTAAEMVSDLGVSAGSGDVVGPASSVASEPALFDGVTGKLLKGGSGVTISATGVINAPAGAVGAPSYTLGGDATSGWYRNAADQVALSISGTARVNINSNFVRLASTHRISWSSTSAATGSEDTGAGRNAAGVMEVNNGTNGTFRDVIVRALNIGAAAAAASNDYILTKAVASIADATATDVFTITIPNASHSATLRVTLCGKIGAGGAIGAGEASGTIAYDIVIARTAGVNAVASISSAYGSAVVAVAGATTITVAGTLGAVSGAVGASNTITVKVTITKGGGASANHTCVARAQLLNANATGISVT